MKTIKYSRQREAIKSFLATRKDHPTADMVYTNIRNEFPNISLGTVYRNLSMLAERGEILKLTLGDNADHFDACIKPHYHFFCHKCHTVTDLELPDREVVDCSALSGFGGRVEGHFLYFYGICEGCRDCGEE